MARLFGAQRPVLQAILDAQRDSTGFVEDSRIARATNISLNDVRDWFLTLDNDALVDLTRTENGLSASVNAAGRLALGLQRVFSMPTQPSGQEPTRSRTKTGRERALVVGISDYLSPIPQLPAVANDVREMAKLLSSDTGQFPSKNVSILIDELATSQKVLQAIESTFFNVQAEDAVFAYLAGHGDVHKDKYYFIAHDTNLDELPSTSVPLTKIKPKFQGRLVGIPIAVNELRRS